MSGRTNGIPFPYIPGLTERAKYELERDFLYVLGLIDAGGVGVFDAIIDPALAAARPDIHEYPNMTTLLANEDWDGTLNFSIGVRGRPGDPITETATMAMPGPFSMRTLGVQGDRWEHGGTGSTDDRAVWDLSGFRMTGVVQGYIEGMLIRNTGANVGSLCGGSIGLVNCILESVNNANTQLTIAEPTSGVNGTVYALNTTFKGTQYNGGAQTILVDCHYEASSIGDYDLCTGKFLWQGGSYWGGGGSTCTINGSGGDFCIIRDIVNPDTMITGGGSAPADIEVSGSGFAFEMEYSGGYGNTLDILVGSSCAQVALRGDAWGDITIQGNSSDETRTIDVTASGIVDITDGCQGNISFQGTTSGLILRGHGNIIQCNGISTGTASGRTFVQLLAATESMVSAVGTGATGSKAYAIDASSSKCVLIFPAHDVGFSVASTNLGTQCTVIDHTGVSLSLTASDIDADDSSWTVLTGADVQLALDSADTAIAGFGFPDAADVFVDDTGYSGVLVGVDDAQEAFDILDTAIAAAGSVSEDLAVFGTGYDRYRFLEHFDRTTESNGVATAKLEGTMFTHSGTGTSVNAQGYANTDALGRWGVWRLFTGTNTTTTGRCGVVTDGATDAAGNGIFYKNYQKTDVWFVRFVLRTPIVTVAGQTFDVYFGLGTSFGSAAAHPVNDFIGFSALADAGNWDSLTIDDTTPTVNDTTIAQDTNYHEFVIYQDGTNIYFYIDGTLRQTHIIASTNVPDNGTDLQLGVLIQKQSGATGRSCHIDLISGDIPLNIGIALSDSPLP